jgi:hypothetical protein
VESSRRKITGKRKMMGRTREKIRVRIRKSRRKKRMWMEELYQEESIRK